MSALLIGIYDKYVGAFQSEALRKEAGRNAYCVQRVSFLLVPDRYIF